MLSQTFSWLMLGLLKVNSTLDSSFCLRVLSCLRYASRVCVLIRVANDDRFPATSSSTVLGPPSGLDPRSLHGKVDPMSPFWYCLTSYRGLVATFQAFQKGLGAFLSTRLLLGYVCLSIFCEIFSNTWLVFVKLDLSLQDCIQLLDGTNVMRPASDSPSTSWVTWLPLEHQVSLHMGCKHDLSYLNLDSHANRGSLHMRGVGGLGGWQWLFIVSQHNLSLSI